MSGFLYTRSVTAMEMARDVTRRNPQLPSDGNEDVRKILTHAVAGAECVLSRRFRIGRLGVEAEPAVEVSIELMQKVERRSP